MHKRKIISDNSITLEINKNRFLRFLELYVNLHIKNTGLDKYTIHYFIKKNYF